MPTYSVSEITSYIRDLFEVDMNLQSLQITGEVTDFRPAQSGHWYFSLKDAHGQLKCVMWRSAAERQRYTPRNGDAVTVQGRITVYEARGEYQLYAEGIYSAGVGDLYQQFEQLKARLYAEGLFDPERKRDLPAVIQRIGVVTSPTAAAFQDIKNILARRYPLAEVILSPALVQGETAPPQMIAAIERLNYYSNADVILLIRGGGSIEDLWAFNDEALAQAIALSRIPIVTGIGHEIDFTIADFVADLRAPTPSAAAEIVTPNIEDLRIGLVQRRETLKALVNDQFQASQYDLDNARRTLQHYAPQRQLDNFRQQVDDWTQRITRAEKQHLARLQERLNGRIAALNAANPEAILARGYAVVYHSDTGERVQSSKDVRPGDAITVQVHDGEIKARVEDEVLHGQYQRTLF